MNRLAITDPAAFSNETAAMASRQARESVALPTQIMREIREKVPGLPELVAWA